MKINIYHTLFLAIAMVLSLSLADAFASSEGKKIISHTHDGVTVTAYNSMGHFHKGKNSFVLKFTKDGKPFDAGKNVKFYFHMPAMGTTMPEMRAPMTITSVKKTGVYKGKGTLSMAGKWTVHIEYGDGKTMAFNITARK